MSGGLPLESFYMGRVLNFGHRGASHDAPANTLAAFDLAADCGADGVELDVRLTADRQPVVIHDSTVDATTDGSGRVAEMSLAEIKALDAGRSFDPRFAGERIPTLGEVFEALGQLLLFNVELKGLSLKPDGLEAVVAQTIARHNMASRVIVSSFNPLRLRRFRRLLPQVAIGYLHMPGQPLHKRQGWLLWGLPHEADHPEQSLVTPKYMAWARSRRLRVNTWVVNDAQRMADLRDMGVDMIITDRPDVLRAVLHGER